MVYLGALNEEGLLFLTPCLCLNFPHPVSNQVSSFGELWNSLLIDCFSPQTKLCMLARDTPGLLG